MDLDTTLAGPASDSYATTEELETYATNMGADISDDITAQKAALRKAAMFLDFSWDWMGEPVSEDQARAHPRGEETEIHRNIKHAQIELALKIFAGVDLFASASARSVVQETVSIDGAVSESVQYDGSSLGSGAARVFPDVDGLLRRFASGVALPSGSFGAASIGINK